MPTVSGTVYDITGATAAGRVVRAYRRDTGALLGTAVSSDGTVYGVGDSNWTSVQLHLKFNGTNGSTTFTDSSPTPKTVTPSGNAQLSTAWAQYGSAAGLFDGTGDFLTVTHQSGMTFGTSAFCIRTWINPTAPAVDFRGIFGNGTGAGQLDFHVNSSGALRVYGNSGGINLTGGTLSSATPAHVELTHDGSGTYKIFKDGVQAATVTTTAIDFNSTANWLVGGAAVSAAHNGYLDDLQVTIGAARHTSAFTPPIEELLTYAPSLLSHGQYQVDLLAYTGEVYVVCLDDVAGATENDLILRTTGV